MSSGYLFFTDFVLGPQHISEFNFFTGFLPYNLLLIALSYVFSIASSQKIIMAFTLLIVLSGGRKVMQHFLEKEAQIFITSLFFLFNPFVYDRLLYGQVGVVSAFGFMCLGIGSLLSSIKGKGILHAVCAGICFGLALQFSLHFIFIIGLIGGCLLVIYKINGARWMDIFKVVGIICGIVFISNANWIVGELFITHEVQIFVERGISSQDAVAFQTAGGTGGEVLKNVLMMSGFWGKEQFRYTDLTQAEGWGRSFWFLVPLILWGAYAGLKNKETRRLSIGLITVFVVAVTLAVGIRLPVAREITYWMFDNVPFYKGMRETQKWVAAIVPVYGIFLAFGIKELFELKYVDMNQKVASLFLSGVIIMQAPLLLWGFGGQVRPVEYPADWYKVDAMIQQESNCEGKILFLPWHMYMSFGWVGNIVANPAMEFFTCPVIQGTNMEFGGIYDSGIDSVGERVGEWIAGQGNTDLLSSNMDNIRYIILAKEVDWQTYDWVSTLQGVSLIKETQTLKVYKVE